MAFRKERGGQQLSSYKIDLMNLVQIVDETVCISLCANDEAWIHLSLS